MRATKVGGFIGLAAAMAAVATAQDAAPLPSQLSGRWSASGPAGVVIDRFVVKFEGTAPGPVKGKLTYDGYNCGAADEPIVEGTWNGSEVAFQAYLRTNVNAKRMNGVCPADRVRFMLRRKPGTSDFEGQAQSSNGTAVTLTASP